MATIAQKLTTEGATVTVRRGSLRERIYDPELSDRVRKAYSLWQELKSLEAELSLAKEIIAKKAEDYRGEGSTVSFETGGVVCTITTRHEAVIPVDNIPELRRLLGRRFKDLVRTKVRHLATGRLLGEACGDVLGLIRLRRLSPQFKWGSHGQRNRNS